MRVERRRLVCHSLEHQDSEPTDLAVVAVEAGYDGGEIALNLSRCELRQRGEAPAPQDFVVFARLSWRVSIEPGPPSVEPGLHE
mmetsp:Transcript_4663/g.15631  ORF Transcript_4663/g.15631 Transcript_4663/m.15631 type:complete len:84 (-) Transcript_4663:210-461(-)